MSGLLRLLRAWLERLLAKPKPLSPGTIEAKEIE